MPDDSAEAQFSNCRALKEVESFQTCVCKSCGRVYQNYMLAIFCFATTELDTCSLYNMLEEVVWSTVGG